MHKAGRNDPCPCGSGKKYKKCHGAGGPKKFVASVLSGNQGNLLSRVSSLAGGLSKLNASETSLKERITSKGDLPEINHAIENAKFNQEHAVEPEKKDENEEKFML